MEDIIQKYKRARKIRNFGIIISALAFALVLNITLTQTDIGKAIRSSVLDTPVVSSAQHGLVLSLESSSGNAVMILKNTGNLKGVKSISFSVLHDEKSVSLAQSVLLASNAKLETLSEAYGVHSYTLLFNTPIDIPATAPLVQFAFGKKSRDIQAINLSSASFTDKDEHLFELRTQGSEF